MDISYGDFAKLEKCEWVRSSRLYVMKMRTESIVQESILGEKKQWLALVPYYTEGVIKVKQVIDCYVT